MSRKSKNKEFSYIIAIKDLVDTKKTLEEETIKLPFERSLYSSLIESSFENIDNLKGLGKFIKSQKKEKNEVKHYWESLILQGYTLMEVYYDKENPPIAKLCNTEKIKYIC